MAAGDDRTRVPHAASGRSRLASDEAHHGLLDVGGDVLGRALFGVATDLTDHDDRVGLGVFVEGLEHIDEVGAVDGVTANANTGGLTKSAARQLPHRFVGEGARTRDHAHAALLVDVARHDADLAGIRSDDARAVRADEARLATRLRHALRDLDHVDDRNAFGDRDDQLDARVDCFENRLSGAGRRHIDDRSIRPSLLACFLDRAEHRQVQVRRARLLRIDATDHLGAVGDRLFAVEGAGLAGEPLADEFRVFADPDAHVRLLTPSSRHPRRRRSSALRRRGRSRAR